LDTKTIREGCLYEVGQTLSTNFWVLLYAFFFHYFWKVFCFSKFPFTKD
jgi:hypothetical protein